ERRVAVTIGEWYQVQRDRRDGDMARESFEQRLLFRRGLDPGVKIGEADQLFQIGPAQQGALHEIEMAARVGVRCQPTQKRGQQRVGVEIYSRGRFVFRRYKSGTDPSSGTD